MENEKTDHENIFVHYKRTGKIIQWDSSHRTLLEFSEAHEIEISSGCRFGDCGTCLTPLAAGEVSYLHATLVEPEPGECLPCSCVPLTNITLDL